MIYFLGILWFLITVVADVVAKTWSTTQLERNNWPLANAAGLYVINAIVWTMMLYQGLPMARGSVIFSSLGIMAGVVIGVVLGEHFSALNWLGVGLAVVAIILVSV